MPIFVLGSVRSATSTVVELLRRHGGFAGNPEGHLWPLLPKLTETCQSYFLKTKLPLESPNGRPNDMFPLASDLGYGRICELLEDCLRQAVSIHYGRDWVDKTPGPWSIQMAPQLRRIFPDAKFLYCYRHPRQCLISRMAKFYQVTFEEHCIDLALCWKNWLSVRDDLGTSCLRVSQQALHRDYVATASAILSFASGRPCAPPAGSAVINRERLTSIAFAPIWTADMERLYQMHCIFIEDADELRGDSEIDGAELFNGTRFLPVIVGQPGVRLQSAIEPIETAVFTETDDLGSWVFLHPGPPGRQVTRAIFERLRFHGENKFSTTAKVQHPKSEPVRFRLEITPSGGRIPCTSRMGVVVQPNGCQPWIEQFAPLHGEYDITLSTEMASDSSSNAHAWAKLLTPVFLRCP